LEPGFPPRVRTRKEPRPLVVVGGAAQLYLCQSKKGDSGVTTGMILRRVSALGILLSAFVGLGVLSFLGNRVLSGIFIVTALVVIVRRK
jgi:hypothetical protein